MPSRSLQGTLVLAAPCRALQRKTSTSIACLGRGHGDQANSPLSNTFVRTQFVGRRCLGHPFEQRQSPEFHESTEETRRKGSRQMVTRPPPDNPVSRAK